MTAPNLVFQKEDLPAARKIVEYLGALQHEARATVSDPTQYETALRFVIGDIVDAMEACAFKAIPEILRGDD